MTDTTMTQTLAMKQSREEWLAGLKVGDVAEIRAVYGGYAVMVVVTRFTPKRIYVVDADDIRKYEIELDRSTGSHRSGGGTHRGSIRPVTDDTRDKHERRTLLDTLPNLQSLSLDQLRRIAAIANEQ